MVPISFEGTSRVPRVDPLNLLPSTEVRPAASDESFESYFKVADESKTSRPTTEERTNKPTEPPSDKSPAASDTRPSPQTDAQEEAP
ncbi:MAG: hypothetical protein ACC628_13385, partial [Pirellulaceae bacterium]